MQKSITIAAVIGILALVSWQAATVAATKTPDAKTVDAAKGKRMGPGDTNADGILSREEWVGAAQRRAENNFKRRDANNDGAVTREEIKAFDDQANARRAARKAAAGKLPAPAAGTAKP